MADQLGQARISHRRETFLADMGRARLQVDGEWSFWGISDGYDHAEQHPPRSKAGYCQGAHDTCAVSCKPDSLVGNVALAVRCQ